MADEVQPRDDLLDALDRKINRAALLGDGPTLSTLLAQRSERQAFVWATKLAADGFLPDVPTVCRRLS